VAHYRVARAEQFNQAGAYTQAADMLSDVPSVLVLPSITHNKQTEAAQTKKWLSYLGYQAKARKLMDHKKYRDALTVLRKIPHDYPTYQTVGSTMEFLRSLIGTGYPSKSS